VDVIARNGSGATETRRELARRELPFGGKKVIVWEFAARDFEVAHWAVVPIANRPAADGAGPTTDTATGPSTTQANATTGPATTSTTRTVAQTRPGALTVVGTISLAAPPPEEDPAYPDAVMEFKVDVATVENGTLRAKAVYATAWGMRGLQLTPAAKLKVGDKVRAVLRKPTQDERQARKSYFQDDTKYDVSPPAYFAETLETVK
jgi:hypothetical protein